MMPLALTTATTTNELLSRAVNAAEFYGFQPMDNVVKGGGTRTKIDRIDPKGLSFVRRDERSLIPLVNTCAGRGLCSTAHPTFFWRAGAATPSGTNRSVSIELHALGVANAVAEALLINVAQAIAEDAGIERRVVRLNSIGAHDSSARYIRELSNYLRKNSDSIAETILARVPSDPLGALLSLVEKQSPVVTRAPQSMEFLNEEERRHLAHVLEFLEAADTYYELNPFVLGSRDCWTHTLFEVHGIHRDTEELVPFAKGGRYDRLATSAMGSGTGAGVGMTLTFELKGSSLPNYNRIKRDNGISTLYFAHLGDAAKRHSLGVMEMLRRAHIPVHQSLAYEHLAEQMAEAQALDVPYVIIMGFKEANEGTIIVRDTRTNSQAAIPKSDLVSYLKRRHIAASPLSMALPR